MHVNPEARGDERGALLAFIAEQRGGLRRTLLGLTEEQALATPTAGELSLAGLLKHVAETEQGWVARAQQIAPDTERAAETWGDSFRLVGDETVKGALDYYDDVARRTEEFFHAVPSLDDMFPLPPDPWYFGCPAVSVRWLGLHLIRETARHAGHADIIRESLDGAKSMG
jgi:hypothetical protein